MTALLRALVSIGTILPRAAGRRRTGVLGAAVIVGFAALTTSSYAVVLPVYYDAVTPGFGFNVDASLFTQDPQSDRWPDAVPNNPSGLDLRLDTANGVSWTSAAGGLPGITAAYDFPGGFTGNDGGALLSTTGTTQDRSFQNAPGDWSNQNVSMEIWFKPDDLTPAPNNGQILFEDGGGTGFGFFVADDELRLRKVPGGGAVDSDISGSAGEFIQAVGTFDVSSGAMELFVNGQSVGDGTADSGTWSGGDPAGIGTRGAANTGGLGGGQQNTESFDGQVAIFRVYNNRVLTADEVQANFDAVTAATPDDLHRYLVSAKTPAGYWRLGESSGSVATNVGSLGSDADGAYTNTPALGEPGLVAGSTDSAVRFDGTDQRIDVADNTILNRLGGGQFYEAKTVELLFQADDTDDRQVLWVQGGATRGLNLYLDGGRLYAQGWNDAEQRWGAEGDEKFVSTGQVTAGQTHHTALVFEGRNDHNGTMSGYLDGVPFGHIGGIARLHAHGPARVGATANTEYFYHDGKQGGEQNAFAGVIDEVAHYSDNSGSTVGALSVEQVQAHYIAATGNLPDHGAYGNAVLADDPIAFFYTGGINVATPYLTADGLGSAVQGTPGASVESVRGLVVDRTGPASYFNGEDGMIAIPNNDAINTSTHALRTIELVFSARDVDSRQILFEEGGNGNGFNVYLDEGELYVGAWRGTTYSDFLSTEVDPFTPYHAALVFDSDNDIFAGYLNGEEFDSLTDSRDAMAEHVGKIAIGAMDNDTRFHDDQGGAGSGLYHFHGLVDSVALYNQALSTEQILAHAQFAVPEPSAAVLALVGMFLLLGGRRRRGA